MPSLAARVLSGRTTPPEEPTPDEGVVVGAHRKAAVPTARELHLLTRFGAGYTPAGHRQLVRAGGHLAWFDQQLNPASVKESATAALLPTYYPPLSWPAAEKAAKNSSGEFSAWKQARDLGNLSLLRRIHSTRQVLEQMVDFWSNVLHIPVNYDRAWVYRKEYDDLLRAHALTSYENILLRATLHPSTQLFLNNYRSVKNAPNENHGRELLELHTVGLAAGYTEQEVKDSAKILSGYTVNTSTWTPHYDPARHTTGPVSVLGFSHPNADPDGQAVTVAYLKYLARHPLTAKRVARKLCVRFVSDSPSGALVDHLAQVYLANGTDIRAVLRALVRHPEFYASQGAKVRTPYDDLVGTLRALRPVAHRPVNDSSFGFALNWMHGSTLVYDWPRPDGSPDNATHWATPTRMLSSFRMHWNAAGGYWPKAEVDWRPSTFFLPRSAGAPVALSFADLVDHLSRRWLGRPSTPSMLQAACESLDLKASATITEDHAAVRWQWPRLVAVLLDHPHHLSR